MAQSIKHVAVVGAGASGVSATAHLKAAGLDVTLFERSSTAGGVWYVQAILSMSYDTD
jgi:cation diffusion facilitator CzcD-associated flavoprotein CzcO